MIVDRDRLNVGQGRFIVNRERLNVSRERFTVNNKRFTVERKGLIIWRKGFIFNLNLYITDILKVLMTPKQKRIPLRFCRHKRVK